MENEPEYEDDDSGPQSRTLATLKLKKESLATLRRTYLMKVKALERDMAALETAMRVFDTRAWAGRQASDAKGRKRQHITGRYILDTLRETDRPLLASEITNGWIESLGEISDANTRQIFGQRVSNSLAHLRRKGLAETVHEPGSRVLWRLVEKA